MKLPRIQGNIVKMLVLSNHQSESQRHSIYNDIKQIQAENYLIYTFTGTSKCLACFA